MYVVAVGGQMDQAQMYRQERADAENGVIRTEIGRYIPPTDRVSAAAVLVRKQVDIGVEMSPSPV